MHYPVDEPRGAESPWFLKHQPYDTGKLQQCPAQISILDQLTILVYSIHVESQNLYMRVIRLTK